MPLYNYICPEGHCFEAINTMATRALQKCNKCSRMAKQTISRRPAAVHSFKFGQFEHLASEPIYVKGKRHMQVLCDEHECYAPGVLD